MNYQVSNKSLASVPVSSAHNSILRSVFGCFTPKCPMEFHSWRLSLAFSYTGLWLFRKESESFNTVLFFRWFHQESLMPVHVVDDFQLRVTSYCLLEKWLKLQEPWAPEKTSPTVQLLYPSPKRNQNVEWRGSALVFEINIYIYIHTWMAFVSTHISWLTGRGCAYGYGAHHICP